MAAGSSQGGTKEELSPQEARGGRNPCPEGTLSHPIPYKVLESELFPLSKPHVHSYELD